MPLYAYNCPACGTSFERIRPIKAATIPAFCECGAEAERVLTAPNVPASGTYSYGKRSKENDQ